MPEFKSYFYATTKLHQLLCTNHFSFISIQELCLSQTLFPLYPSDSQSMNFLCFSESQKNSVIFSTVSFARSKNNDLNNYRIVGRILHGLYCHQDIYHNPQWSQCGCSVLVVVVRNSLYEWCTCDPCLHSSPLPFSLLYF